MTDCLNSIMANEVASQGNCGDSMVGFQGGIDYVNQQGIRQVSPTGLGSSNVNCALPMMLGSSEHPNSTVNSAVNSGISGDGRVSVNYTVTPVLIGDPNWYLDSEATNHVISNSHNLSHQVEYIGK
ncbi:uncharacterized protein LOC112489789 isoform X2 [Ziziphus jujuba]|uniref:Uncharacterized protein LOC112489789 isoform X2 n=1 Tax=Ziziphus jujuba TaxID=326968 RepID=A0A6P6FSQ5_ZIZJJ|nr:uncharacterized protein LOC112489789 isoform X2 [Ziziphus jujuba]